MATKTSPVSKPPKRLPTDEELMDLPKDGYKRELLDGEIVMSPAGSAHGRKIMRFAANFANHVYQHKLGEVFDGQTGFRMRSLDVLSPDISFIAKARLIGLKEAPEGFYEGSPDLAIEFFSPRESKKRMKRKLEQYFENGARLAWVMYSKQRIVAVHRAAENPVMLRESDELSGEEVVPGYCIAVAKIFAGMEDED
jgi:Uma2 family endonuclease